jgi:hypothetical protein
MHARRAALLALAGCLAGAAFADVEISPEHAEIVRVRWVQGSWTGLLAADPLGEDANAVYLVSGELENAGSHPIAWVRLRYELLDDAYRVVASEHGYNRRAEALREPAVEAGQTAAEVAAIEPGGSDGFRMMFFRSDVPRFSRWRVTVLAVGKPGQRPPDDGASAR